MLKIPPQTPDQIPEDYHDSEYGYEEGYWYVLHTSNREPYAWKVAWIDDHQYIKCDGFYSYLYDGKWIIGPRVHEPLDFSTNPPVPIKETTLRMLQKKR